MCNCREQRNRYKNYNAIKDIAQKYANLEQKIVYINNESGSFNFSEFRKDNVKSRIQNQLAIMASDAELRRRVRSKGRAFLQHERRVLLRS